MSDRGVEELQYHPEMWVCSLTCSGMAFRSNGDRMIPAVVAHCAHVVRLSGSWVRFLYMNSTESLVSYWRGPVGLSSSKSIPTAWEDSGNGRSLIPDERLVC
nr:hypothetical protein Iba_chr03bCG2580 [Ipomoea batatas]